MTATATSDGSVVGTPALVEPARSVVTVPWSTVLVLALVLAYADGFWTTSLHAAVGDISRIQEPFTSYWRTTPLTVPLFVVAVLAAVTVGVRRYGPELRSRRSVATTALLVALAASAAAVTVSVVSAAYDYHLQGLRLGMMGEMQHDCSATCLTEQHWMTLSAHGRAIAYTALAVLVTNLALVTWIVALRGGRLRVAGRPAPAPGARRAITTGGRLGDVRLIMVAGLLAPAVIHMAVIPEHLEEWWAAGTFFVVLTAAEFAVAVGLRRSGRPWLLAAVWVSAVPLAVWTVSRSVGLPFGPEAGSPEGVGVADSVACVLELGTLVAAAMMLRSSRLAAGPPLPRHLRALAVAAVVAVGAIGLAGAVPTWLDGAEAPSGEMEHHVVEHQVEHHH